MKKFLIVLMLVGCGTQTPEEIRIEEYTQSFVEDCVEVYGDMCKEVRLETFVSDEPNSCWTEHGSIKRGLALKEDLVKSNKKTEIYKEMLNCTVFATEHVVSSTEFLERLGIK